MRAVHLRAPRAVWFFAPERRANQNADRDAEGKPDAHVSSQQAENCTQRRSEQNAESCEF